MVSVWVFTGEEGAGVGICTRNWFFKSELAFAGPELWKRGVKGTEEGRRGRGQENV